MVICIVHDRGFRMPLAPSTNLAPSLHDLWHDTLARVDVSDPRLSVRPHEVRSDKATVERGSSTGVPILQSSSSGGIEPGLADLDQMRSGQDRFVLGGMLGRGGMSVVLQALQRSLGRQVAVKVARYDLDQRQRDRFRAESKLTAWLEHPNITPVYEAGRNYLVMRRISGHDLERRLAAGELSTAQAVEVLIKICDAVSFAHHRGIIHRDIKPENILVGDFGEVMLIDWGLALTWRPSPDGIIRAPVIGEGTALCAGTPGYMAPEMALGQGERIGTATDVFLLGATLYRILGGDIPFAGQDVWAALERSARNQWVPLSPILRPRRLVAVQESAMAEDPAKRPTMAEFQSELREWLMRSQSEAEARRILDHASRLRDEAAARRLRPHESYHDFAACIAACDRALALNPDLAEAAGLRATALVDFTLAAVGAGELQLARLIKENGRLPILPPAGLELVPSDEDASTARRLGLLVQKQGDGEDVRLRRVLQELVVRQRLCERLEAANASLRLAYDTATRERDALAVSHGHDEASRRRMLRWVGVALAGAAVVAILALFG